MTTNYALETVAKGMLQDHLSEDQIDDHLMGDLGEPGAGHLAECALCSRRVAQAAEPLANFRYATMAWSERRSATMPMPATTAQGLVWQRRMGWVTATFVLGFGMASVNLGHRAALVMTSVSPTQPESQTAGAPAAGYGETGSAVAAQAVPATALPVAAVAGAPEGAQLSQGERFSADNTMLKAVDGELSATVESPAALGLETASDEDEGDPSRTAARPALLN